MCILPLPEHPIAASIVTAIAALFGGALSLVVRHYSSRTRRAMEEALTKKAELDYEMELAKGLQEQVDRLRQENRVLQLDVTVAQKERGLLFAQTTELQGMVDRLTYDKDTLGRDLENAKAQADSAFAEIRRRLTSLDSFLRSGRHPEAVE